MNRMLTREEFEGHIASSVSKVAAFMKWRKRNKGRFRSADTGRFVTAFFAFQHPKTTVREKV